MPALPWTTIAAPPETGEVLVLASRLRLRHLHQVPGFMRRALRVHAATKEADGAIGASLLAQPAAKTFWTLSVWTDEAAMRRFVGHPVHRDVMRRYQGSLHDATFVTWTESASVVQAPPSWDDARTRVLAAA